MRFLMLLTTLGVFGCGHGTCRAPPLHTGSTNRILEKAPIYHFNLLAWYDYDGQAEAPRADRALFVLNGVEEGRGRDGLRRALGDLAAAPKGTVLYIAFPRRYQGSSRLPYQMPFELLGLPEWDQLIEGGKLQVQWITGGEF